MKKKNRIFLYIHISDILYLTISTMHLFEAEWFLPPLPSKRLKVETGGERWEPHAAAAQKELNKQRKKTFGIDTVRPVIAVKGLQLQYNLPPTQEKLKAHFTLLINQSMR